MGRWPCKLKVWVTLIPPEASVPDKGNNVVMPEDFNSCFTAVVVLVPVLVRDK